ncbi:MAG: tetratricopeptide repeat protein [Magnetococcales bacterium]|nr:tetratricopeptide repeat protein [Magnetococcales bacterium]
MFEARIAKWWLLIGLCWSAGWAWAEHPATKHVEQGNLALTKGREDEALRLYSRALRSFAHLPRRMQAAALGGRCQLRLAASARRQSTQLLEMALRDCDRAVTLQSNQGIWYAARSRIRAIRGEWEQAEEDNDVAMRLGPEDDRLRLDRARILRHLDRAGEALGWYDQLLQGQPDQRDALLERAALLLAQGKTPKAMEDLTRLKNAHPWDGEVARLRGEALIAQNKITEALEALDHAIGMNPEDPVAYLQRGSLRASRAQFREAREDFARAVALRPEDPSFLANLGLMHFLQGEYGLAEGVFRQAETLRPEDPYAPLWRHVTRRRGGGAEAAPEPRASVDRAWPAPLYGLFRGQLTPEAVVVAANRLPEGDLRRSALTEAWFFNAQERLLQGDVAGAREWLERILADENAAEVVLRAIAQEETRRVGTEGAKSGKKND